MSSTEYVRGWLNDHLFDAVPMSTAVIDREFNLVYANPAFTQMFGNWQGGTCYAVKKRRGSVCPRCSGADAFEDGIARVTEEAGYNGKGQLTRYIKHTTPMRDAQGRIPYLIEMIFDITDTEQMRQEYQLLFDQVPCSILLIDRNFRILRINERIREVLGDIEGQYCFEGLKGNAGICAECTARDTFADGQQRTGHHVWQSKTGETTHQHVITVPVRVNGGPFDMIMELAVDVTQTLKLESDLKFANTFLETMVATSMYGIFALDKEGEVTILNPSARRLFKLDREGDVSREVVTGLLPEGFLSQVAQKPERVYWPETNIRTTDGDALPVRLVGNRLQDGDAQMGMAFSVQDVREIKELEREKLEAERLAAVGQTVAGLAHGVKNLITALEGGMYMMSSGIDKGNVDRVHKGMEMLGRNIDRVSMFVRAFLDFSKGRKIHARLSHPAEIAEEVVNLYAAKTQELGIELVHESEDGIQPAAIDYDSMHECLTNLVGNAIDACRVSEGGGTHVTVRTFEKDDIIVYEVVDDGCGMDYEVKRKVFTSFFTTKGLGGTGLGLLTTKKSVQEHGGTIDLESEPGEGTVFRINLPRNRLPKTDAEDQGVAN